MKKILKKQNWKELILNNLDFNTHMNKNLKNKLVFTFYFGFCLCNLFAAPKEGNIAKIKPSQTKTITIYSLTKENSQKVPSKNGKTENLEKNVDIKSENLQENWIKEIFLQKFNVNLQIIYTNTTKDLKTSPFDILIWDSPENEYKTFVKEGLLLNWEENDRLKKWTPYISSNLSPALSKNKFLDSPDLQIHGIGSNCSSSPTEIYPYKYTWNLQFDLFNTYFESKQKNNKHNFFETDDSSDDENSIETLQDLLEVFINLKKIGKENNPEKDFYALSISKDFEKGENINLNNYISSLMSAYFGYMEFGPFLYNPKTGNVSEICDDNSPYLESLKFFNLLYQENLITPSSNNQKKTQVFEDYNNNIAFWSYADFIPSNEKMFPVCPVKAEPLTYGLNVYGSNKIWTVSSNSENPELCLAIINYLATPEGQLSVMYGPKEQNWTIKNSKLFFTEKGKSIFSSYSPDFFKNELLIWDKNSLNNISKGETYNFAYWQSENQTNSETYKELFEKWRKWSEAKTQNEYLLNQKNQIFPQTLYVPNEYPKELKTKNIENDIKKIYSTINKYSWEAIFAKNDESFDEIISKMKNEISQINTSELKTFYQSEAEARKIYEVMLTGHKKTQSEIDEEKKKEQIIKENKQKLLQEQAEKTGKQTDKQTVNTEIKEVKK